MACTARAAYLAWGWPVLQGQPAEPGDGLYCKGSLLSLGMACTAREASACITLSYIAGLDLNTTHNASMLYSVLGFICIKQMSIDSSLTSYHAWFFKQSSHTGPARSNLIYSYT